MPGEPQAVPLMTPPRGVRADAARNRAAILEAARQLMTDDPDGVSMQAVAQRAGVGVGTLYRRFGDRQGLLLAVLDEGERRFQEAFLAGPAPLGPGDGVPVDPAERVHAFIHALLDRTLANLELLLAVERREGSHARPHSVWHLHLRTLCAALGRDRVPDPHYWADLLLAALGPALLRDQLALGATPQGLHTALDVVVVRVLRT
jgi:AcrR family transcriptional regulator